MARMVLIPVAHAQLILKRFSKGQCMKASPDRIKARAQELRAQGNKVQASLDMNAGATSTTETRRHGENQLQHLHRRDHGGRAEDAEKIPDKKPNTK